MKPSVWPEVLRLLWQASCGSRLRPWRSPYLRWRIETYSGLDADSIGAADFCRFVWRERRSLARYLEWAAVMRAGSGSPASPDISPTVGNCGSAVQQPRSWT